MNISYERLLDKMEQELKSARATKNVQKLQGHMYALKILAEVILEEDKTRFTKADFDQPIISAPAQVMNKPVQGMEKPLETDDGANGDSLFDF